MEGILRQPNTPTGLSILKKKNGEVSNLSGVITSAPGGVMFSPRGPTTPKRGISDTTNLENEDPQMKKPVKESGNYAAKNKRMKKLVKEIPDIGSVEDIMKLSEQLSEKNEKLQQLTEKTTLYETQIKEQEQAYQTIVESRDQLQKELKDAQSSKDVIIGECYSKTQTISRLEQELTLLNGQFNEEKQKNFQLEGFLREERDAHTNSKKRIDELTNSLNESVVEFRMKSQQWEDIRDTEQRQIKEITTNNKQLQTKLQNETTSYQSSVTKMESQIDQLRQDFFVSTAIAIKLNLTSANVKFNDRIPISVLYEKIQSVPVNDWPRSIHKYLLLERN